MKTLQCPIHFTERYNERSISMWPGTIRPATLQSRQIASRPSLIEDEQHLALLILKHHRWEQTTIGTYFFCSF